MIRQRLISAALSAASLGLAPLAAHADPWFAPSEINFSGDNPTVAVDAVNSDDLGVLERPLDAAQIKAVSPDGSELQPTNVARGGMRTTFDLRLAQPGTSRIVTTGQSVSGTYSVDGQAYRLDAGRRGGGAPGGGPPGGQQGGPGPQGPGQGGGQAPQPGRAQAGVSDPAQIPANATDVKLVQSFSRAETFVTRGAPSAWKTTGVGLELAPGGTSPTDAATDEPSKFNLIMFGKPAAGAEVEITPANHRYVAKPADLKLKADATGGITVKWPAPGLYWLKASMDGAGTLSNATSHATYSAVVVVQKP